MSTIVTRRISGLASGGKTSRVTENPTGTHHTSRFHHLLLLEGDMQDSGEDYLLLEGDMQDGTDVLKLEGDITAIGGTTSKRVPELVT